MNLYKHTVIIIFTSTILTLLTFSINAQVKMALILETKIGYLNAVTDEFEVEKLPSISPTFGIDANYFFSSGIYISTGLTLELTNFKSIRHIPPPFDEDSLVETYSRNSIGFPINLGYQFNLSNEVISTGFIIRPRITLLEEGETHSTDPEISQVTTGDALSRKSDLPVSFQYYLGTQREFFKKSILMIQIFTEYDSNRFYYGEQLFYTSAFQFGLKLKYLI